jgi:hydrogenase maturation protease
MILVIGYGNPLCGDDGVGPYITGRLADEAGELSGDIECQSLRQLTPELAEDISRATAVIFIDAEAGGKIPGGITCYKLAKPAKPSERVSGAFTHHVSPETLLENAGFLYGRRPVAYLYTVSGENFNLGTPFSPAVEAAIPGLFERLKSRINRCTNLVLLKQ